MKQGLEKPLRSAWPDEAVVVGLGASLAGAWPSPQALLEAAVVRLGELGLRLGAHSSWWRSKAWPNPSDPSFVNGVALFHPNRSPHEVLGILLAVEREFGRGRGQPNAPRTLDLDLVAHGRVVMDDRSLTLPHPRAHERRFVMGPLAEAAPAWRHPIHNATAEALTKRAMIGIDARPISCAALHKKA